MEKNSDYYLELLQMSYENDRTVRAIIRFSGLNEFFRHIISDPVKDIRLERSKTFFNELERGNILLTDEIIKSEDFLHKFYISYKSAINTRRREKIEMFARLLKSSFTKKIVRKVDVFEEYLKILEELSYREIQALVLLDSFYDTPKSDGENDLEWINKYWGDFKEQLQEKIDIHEEYINDFMVRLSRTGLYDTFTGQSYWSDTEAKGLLTPTFERLKDFALTKIEDQNNQQFL